MKKLLLLTAAITLLGLSVGAQADVFHLGSAPDGTVLTNLETVTVGDPGNAADTRYETPGYGSVGYIYNIGKYEVTAAQYTEFLNAVAKADTYGLYNVTMSDPSGRLGSGALGCNIQRSGFSGSYSYTVAADWANRPVNLVSYWDSLRFANWLNNGQADGDTETGAYALNGYNDWDGRTLQRNAGWKWAVTSEDEWYKAAYYKGRGTDAGYWEYPTRSNSVPGCDLSGTNDANYYIHAYLDMTHWRTEVGAFSNSKSAYGTFDQGGNVGEWNEAVVYQDYKYQRGWRGGAFDGGSSDGGELRASRRSSERPTNVLWDVGFRVAAVPEPSSMIVLVGGLGLLALRRCRL